MARILVVDDDAVVRTALAHALRNGGYEVAVAADGSEALKLCRASQTDLAVVDLFMPETDGLEVITQFRRDFPHLPIIAVSGGHVTSQAMLIAAQELGATKVLEKPIEPDQILQMVAAALKNGSH